MRDSAAVLDVLAGWEPGDPYTAPPAQRRYLDEVGRDPGRLRIGVRTDHVFGSMTTDPECVAAALATADLLESLGHDVARDASPAALGEASFMGPFMTILSVAMSRQVAVLEDLVGRPLTPEDLEPANWASGLAGSRFSGADYLGAIEAVHAYSRRMAAWWSGADGQGGYDLLLTPTLAGTPPELGQLVASADDVDAASLRVAELIPFTAQFNATGQPAMSLPLSTSSTGLPIGSQLVAEYGREDLLFRVAAQIEAAEPWAPRVPTISAT